MMVEQDLGRVPVIRPGSRTLIGLLSRKDLLTTRAHLAAAERDRMRYIAPATFRPRRIARLSARKEI